MRVLVVDDDPDLAEALVMTLEQLGHQVEAVHDGASAIERAAAAPPDAILLDIGLPDMDGHEVARRLRAGPAAAARLVALTGDTGEAERERSRAAGFDVHLVKPVEPDDLERALAG